ncbi:hypothetical protein E4631_25110 [Hymenobacter sp. UV11]|uniref:hypothetical protein n=1 Tax=Hymenobacter sp. UV11 TaxID=1849735 RepID=UPI00105F64A0|nr:hypothetical protein [Hymenobacter sp. UV11]TDN37250.1 hypothetical protein A8B98_04750 [Hymenobacter sp. UV11]TFZ62438.1 hypothetical protein E4631_25110 [Hymenobacter sp. UV11]
MSLNHPNLAVSNVVQTQELLENYFGLRANISMAALAVLTDGNRFTLTLSHFKNDHLAHFQLIRLAAKQKKMFHLRGINGQLILGQDIF